MVLYDGKVIAFGPTEEIFSRVRGSRTPAAAPKMPPQSMPKASSRAAVTESV
jgi:hypothetical protein